VRSAETRSRRSEAQHERSPRSARARFVARLEPLDEVGELAFGLGPGAHVRRLALQVGAPEARLTGGPSSARDAPAERVLVRSEPADARFEGGGRDALLACSRWLELWLAGVRGKADV
jgi:hypothetical protein